MTIEKGTLKDWDDRHYQSIDDLPPEAWDAVRDQCFKDGFYGKSIKQSNDIKIIAEIIQDGIYSGLGCGEIAFKLSDAGFKRD